MILCLNFDINVIVSPQVQPFNFSVLGAIDDPELGVLIVRDNGSTVSFSVDVVAIPCPDVVWSFNGRVLGPSNDTFNYNNPCTEEGMNWTFTLDVALTATTSGRYSANLSNIAGMVPLPNAYFTIPSGMLSMTL